MLKLEDLKKLINADYQTRKGEYPKSNIPDSIAVDIDSDKATVEFTFKNTTKDDTNTWYGKSKEMKIINKYAKEFYITISTQQDGDYSDDWVLLLVSITSKNLTTASQEIKQKKVTKSGNIKHTYCYILSTQEQRDSIDLTKYKTKLSKVIKEFFTTRLVSIEIGKSTYTITLKELFTLGDKRKLGRVISDNTDLKQYVRTIAYNGGSDKSGQLFKIKKDRDNAIINK
jgi:hypothetical protein